MERSSSVPLETLAEPKTSVPPPHTHTLHSSPVHTSRESQCSHYDETGGGIWINAGFVTPRSDVTEHFLAHRLSTKEVDAVHTSNVHPL